MGGAHEHQPFIQVLVVVLQLDLLLIGVGVLDSAIGLELLKELRVGSMEVLIVEHHQGLRDVERSHTAEHDCQSQQHFHILD